MIRRRLSVLIVAATTLVVPMVAAVGPAVAAPTVQATSVPATLAYDQIVVKVDLTGGHSVAEVTTAYPVVLDTALLRSRGIYLLHATRAADRGTPAAIAALANRVATSRAVRFAEPNYVTTLTSNRYHSWPEGDPTGWQSSSDAWLDQPSATALKLRQAHGYSSGVGVRVAVLDTGIDPGHPALAGRTVAGYDYVDDDPIPTDVRMKLDSDGNGDVDAAYGHGTFVAGMVALVAPDARIMPYRVLNSDGVGNVFVVAQAILDAVDARARVINISFGTDQAAESLTLRDAIAAAQARGVIVVAAAGNDASTDQHYPAANPGVISVTSLNGSALSSWANRGSWVKVAAPGDSVVGPVPGGGYASWSGTSMASPLVAGQVALVRSRFPMWTTAAQIADITSSAQPVAGVANGAIDIVGSLNHPVPGGGDDG